MNEGPRAQITAALLLLIDCAHLYARADDQGRRLSYQAVTNGIEIGEDEEASIRLAEAFAIARLRPAHVGSSSTSLIVVPWRQFVNLGNHLQNFISKALQGKNGGLETRSACDSSPISEDRGAVVREWATLRTQLGRSESTDLAADFANGIKISGLIEKYGISRSSVYEHLKKNGVELDKNLLEEQRIDRAVELYQAGMTLVEVAKEIGSNRTSVREALKGRGVPRRARGTRVAVDKNRAT